MRKALTMTTHDLESPARCEFHAAGKAHELGPRCLAQPFAPRALAQRDRE